MLAFQVPDRLTLSKTQVGRMGAHNGSSIIHVILFKSLRSHFNKESVNFDASSHSSLQQASLLLATL
jgi:hypothetical protein